MCLPPPPNSASQDERIVLSLTSSSLCISQNRMLIPVKPHAHSYYEIVFLVDGTLCHHLTSGGQESVRTHTPGDIFVINPAETHWYEYRANKKVLFYNLSIVPVVYSDIMQAIYNSGSFDTLSAQSGFFQHEKGFCCLHVERDDFAQMETLLKEALREYNHVYYGTPVIIQSLFTAILMLICRHWAKQSPSNAPATMNSNSKIIMCALNFIQNNYADVINIDALAKSLYVSTDYFRKAFKRITGMSPVKYINNLRIRHAMDLLRSADLSISSIAAMTGFSDLNHFTRCFVRVNEMPPSVYRKRALGKELSDP